jgi:hypothetical protein
MRWAQEKQSDALTEELAKNIHLVADIPEMREKITLRLTNKMQVETEP